MLEACVHVRVETERHNDWVVMAVDVRVHTEQTLNELTDSGLKVFGEVNTCGVYQ